MQYYDDEDDIIRGTGNVYDMYEGGTLYGGSGIRYIDFVKDFRASNPGLSWKDSMVAASPFFREISQGIPVVKKRVPKKKATTSKKCKEMMGYFCPSNKICYSSVGRKARYCSKAPKKVVKKKPSKKLMLTKSKCIKSGRYYCVPTKKCYATSGIKKRYCKKKT